MMRNPSQTIGNLIEKASMTSITYIDAQGYPVSRAMLPPREREGIKYFWFTTNTSSQKSAVTEIIQRQAFILWINAFSAVYA